MSDKVKLGELLSGPEERDAVHVAIFPVIAGEYMAPGSEIGFKPGSEEEVIKSDGGRQLAGQTPVISLGIVDPFLKSAVAPGQRFWMFLFPGSTTAMKHHWSAPGFDMVPAAGYSVKTIKQSREWLEGFAEQLELSLDEVIAAAEDYIDNGNYFTLGVDTPECVYEDGVEFWKHIKIVTGKENEPGSEYDTDQAPFSCSC